MNWKIIAVTILVTTEMASALAAPEIVTHLPADLRLSLQDVRGAFQIRDNVSAIPDTVGNAFAKATGEERFAMAEPGMPWQATDVVRQPTVD
jgi:hypothetical protein